jgi:sugar O-acyltransferase (sialic acid O-acetyltransferase NeuD family)
MRSVDEDSPANADAIPLLIFPFNGNGIEALDCLGNKFRLVGFIDDTPQKQGAAHGGIQVHSRAALEEFPDALVIAVPGSPTSFRTRRTAIDSLGLDPLRFATVIHPTAWVSPGATIGRNVLIMAGVVITSNAVIGDHVCVLPNSVIHHDSHVGNWSLIGSNVTVAGGTSVGDNCYIGSGCSLMNGLQIGARTIIGLGSTVIRSCGPDSRLAGNPARLLP